MTVLASFRYHPCIDNKKKILSKRWTLPKEKCYSRKNLTYFQKYFPRGGKILTKINIDDQTAIAFWNHIKTAFLFKNHTFLHKNNIYLFSNWWSTTRGYTVLFRSLIPKIFLTFFFLSNSTISFLVTFWHNSGQL